MNSVAPGIEVTDDVVVDCDEIIRIVSEGKWTQSRVVVAPGQVEEVPTRTSSTAFLPFMSYRLPEPIAEMNKRVWMALNDYAMRWNFSFGGVEDVSVQRYAPGQHYNLHHDADGQPLRVVSAVLYLNDVEEGGQTYFPTFDVGVTPKAGRLAVFPANFVYAHEARPPAVGTKYAAAFWAYQ